MLVFAPLKNNGLQRTQRQKMVGYEGYPVNGEECGTMKRGVQKSKSIFFWTCLVGCLFLVLDGKLNAAQFIDSGFEIEIMPSCIQVAQADESETNEASQKEAEEKEGWLPPEPRPEKFDWIQLKSGEWLKGKLEVLYDRKLEFDSDELDELTFDFEVSITAAQFTIGKSIDFLRANLI